MVVLLTLSGHTKVEHPQYAVTAAVIWLINDNLATKKRIFNSLDPHKGGCTFHCIYDRKLLTILGSISAIDNLATIKNQFSTPSAHTGVGPLLSAHLIANTIKLLAISNGFQAIHMIATNKWCRKFSTPSAHTGVGPHFSVVTITNTIKTIPN